MSMLDELKKELRAAAIPEKAVFFPRFFKTGPGQYGEGDKFLGVTVPVQRAIANKYYRLLPLTGVVELLGSEWHEERLTALLILVLQFKQGNEASRKEIYNLYITHTGCVNNWDLVDSSAEHIVGAYLNQRPEKMKVLIRLAHSKDLWERRISIISTFYFIKQGRADETLAIAEILIQDRHDLIQKAVGWMLREIGKRVDSQLLKEFLAERAADMPRTSLRYALEHFSPDVRAEFMSMKKNRLNRLSNSG